jgi:hypothetical protein
MKSHYYCRPRFIGSIRFDMSRLQENNNDDDDAPIVSTSLFKTPLSSGYYRDRDTTTVHYSYCPDTCTTDSSYFNVAAYPTRPCVTSFSATKPE